MKILSILLVIIGLLQFFGHITGLKVFKQVGLVTVASPLLPKKIVASVLDYAFIKPATMTKAFGLEHFEHAHIKLESKTKGVNKTYYLPIGVPHD